MKEEKIKSALEIAMEKISDLPELTRDEIEKQKEKEYGPVGNALARKYLSETISDGELTLQLTGHSGTRGRIVRRALIEGLCRELRLENYNEVGGRVMRGLKILSPERRESVDRRAAGFREIVDQFVKEKEEKSRRFEILAKERFRDLGIAGSAVRPNLKEDAPWKEQLREIQNIYEPRLAEVRNRLMQELQQA